MWGGCLGEITMSEQEELELLRKYFMALDTLNKLENSFSEDQFFMMDLSNKSDEGFIKLKKIMESDGDNSYSKTEYFLTKNIQDLSKGLGMYQGTLDDTIEYLNNKFEIK